MRIAMSSTCVLLCLAAILLVPSGALAEASAPRAGGSAPAAASAPVARVNVNTAGVAELDTLPGIGPALAGRIIEYRQENGPFKRIDELLAVKGIGARLVTKLRDRVTVGDVAKQPKKKAKS